MTIYAYLRVSTAKQDEANQRHAIGAYGFTDVVYVAEAVSGRVPALERPAFKDLLNKVKAGDTLITIAVDRLGRHSGQNQEAFELLWTKGVNFIALREGGTRVMTSADLPQLLIACMLAQMERDFISKRTKEALARKKAEGVVLGRVAYLDHKAMREEIKARGLSVRKAAVHFGVSPTTIQKLLKADD